MERFAKNNYVLYALLLCVMTSSALFMPVRAMDSKGQELEDHASSQDHVKSASTQDAENLSSWNIPGIDQVILDIGYKTHGCQNSVARRIHIGSSNYFFHRFGCQSCYSRTNTGTYSVTSNKIVNKSTDQMPGYKLVGDEWSDKGEPIVYFGKLLFRCNSKLDAERYVDSNGLAVPVKDSDIQYLATINTIRHPIRAAVGASTVFAGLTVLLSYGT